MLIREVMTSDVTTLDPEATLQEAAEKMKELDIGAIPVEVHGETIGIVTDRDITIRSTARGNNPMLARVGQAMTRHVECCFDDDDVARAAQIMKEKQIRRLCVLNHDRRLVGIVSLGDLAVETGDELLVGETLERISEPAAAA